jgi:uncharacterized protein
MNAPVQTRLLDDAEIARLDALLEAANPQESMTVEELDGFLAALACSPEPVPEAEYFPVVIGRRDDAGDADAAQAHPELARLLERHRQSVASQLYTGDQYAPVLAYDEEGVARGNDWAIGFVRGMAMRPDAWGALDDDPEVAELLDPVMVLVGEVEPTEEGGEPPEPVRDEDRKALMDDMFGAVMDVYEYFRPQRERNLGPAKPARRTVPKVGRNDPCPCGSGRKYKQCHGASGS